MDYPDRRHLDQRVVDALNSNDKGVNYAKAGSTGGNEGNYDIEEKSS